MKKIIVTGFGPFGDYEHNPTIDLTKYWHGYRTDGFSVEGHILPSSYTAHEALYDQINEDRDDIICIFNLGYASSKKIITLETLAYNEYNSKYEDCEHRLYTGKVIDPNADPTYRANIDVLELKIMLENAGILVGISEDPGGYICNSLFFNISKSIKEGHFDFENILIHIPTTIDHLTTGIIESGKEAIKTDIVKLAIGIMIHHMADKYSD